ncbi:MAG TPA: circadian clock protein KaiC [Burkholderiales bacterium]|nr:circadian clock protein KaiC [Burkholderiales bacterium]
MVAVSAAIRCFCITATALKGRPGIGTRSKTARPLPKLATGIEGFDELSRGGLPRHRTSLLIGGPGAGKTVFALQCLVNAVRRQRAPGIFVAFEESPRQIIANGATFNWGLASLAEKELFFLDAHLSPTLVKAGDFDLAGMLAMLTAKKKEIGAQWIVFDGIDVLLTLLQDPVAEMREIYRIRDWLADNALTAIVTAKLENRTSEAMHYGFLQFMVDCVVRFERRQEERVSAQSIQITKYRGSGYAAAEFPVSFGPSGIEVGAAEPAHIGREASSERISAGFKPLDAMLGGGVFRGSSTLITGVPGTSKTTLAGKFAEAACRRGERTLFVSYDEAAEQIARNLLSVGIQLKAHVKSGLLRMYSARTEGISADEHLTKLRSLIREHRPRCLVIDPLTAIAKAGSLGAARTAANRLIYMAKDEGITLFVTALSETDDPRAESSDLQISTIADTWIHLSYLVRSGERNRALTIIKSRGTSHSNQVRELVLSKSGPTLTDVYSAGGEVLMGTLRWEKEAEESARKTRHRAEFGHKRRELQSAEAKTSAQIKALEMDLQRQRDELALHSGENEVRKVSSSERENELRRRRSADPPDISSRKSENGAAK